MSVAPKRSVWLRLLKRWMSRRTAAAYRQAASPLRAPASSRTGLARADSSLASTRRAPGISRCRFLVSKSDSTGKSENVAHTFVSSYFTLPDDEICEYLDRKRLVYRVQSDEICIKECPFCHDTKGRADNMWKLYLKRGSGAFFCHRCGAKGSWYDLKQRMGDLRNGIVRSFGDDMQQPSAARETAPLPDQRQARAEQELLRDGQFPRSLEFLTDERGLDVQTMELYGIGAGRHSFFADGVWTEEECISFPWISGDGSGTIVRLKHRALSSKAKTRLSPKGGQWGLFGLHTVPPDADYVVVTEGEFDAMAVHQMTGFPAVSLPNGARSLPVEILPQLERFRKIFLWMDDDLAGREGARRIAKKLGLGRCFLVASRNGQPDGPKDANEVLLDGSVDPIALLQQAAPVPHEDILSFRDLRGEVYDELMNKDQSRGIRPLTLPKLAAITKGLRRGELTIFTGRTGMGKTTMLSQLSLDYCLQGAQTLWGSFEIKNSRLALKMLRQLASQPEEEFVQNFSAYADRFESLPMFFMRFFGSTSLDEVIDAMDYAVYAHDVEHVIIDNLQFMTGMAFGRGFDKFEAQDRAIERFRKFASDKDIHVSLVVHPRKEDDGALLTTSSVFGSAKATQEADNVIILQTGRYYKYLDVTKNRFDGDLGRVPFKFEKATNKYSELTQDEVQELDEMARFEAMQAMRSGGPGGPGSAGGAGQRWGKGRR